MPYNSSSFERQLAKHRQAEAEKAVGEAPRKKYESYSYPHKTNSRIPSADRGTIKSYAKDPLQLMGEGAQTTPVISNNLRDLNITPIIVKASKKPWYKRTWFILFVITTLPTAFAPILYKEQIAQVKEVAGSIKGSTGVDPFAMKTYTDLIKHQASTVNTPPQPSSVPGADGGNAVDAMTRAAPQPAEVEKIEPMDMNNAVQKAQQRAEEITSQGTGYSMKYIEDETKRLNDAAKKFDDQYKR